MSGRLQPEHGADSAQALAEYPCVFHGCGKPAHDPVHDVGPSKCAACSLPAVTDGYCAGHARLGEYRVTDETHWAANE